MNSKSNEHELLKNIKDFNIFLKSKAKETSNFTSVINRLNQLTENIENEKIEIALVGITSSGKSTLLNKLLGEDFLPRKVRPCSSIQVVCQYGKRTSAEIYFEDRDEPEIIYKDIKHKVESYGDETENPHNQKRVKEIRIFSSKYRLKHNIVIVDTPGLNAYEQQNHEYITLKLVVPTVHMVMFLISIKPSSEVKNLEMIDEVTTDDKPLLFVQNMIDAIVPKEAKAGILKTKEEVQAEHKNRIYNLLGKARKQSVKQASVLQVSAKTGENIDNLIKEIDEQASLISPRRFKIIQDQFFSELDTLKTKLIEEKTGNYQNNQRINQYVKKQNTINNYHKAFLKSYLDITKEIDDQVERSIMTIQKIANKYGSFKGKIKNVDDLRKAIDSVSDTEDFDSNLKQELDNLPANMNRSADFFKKNINQSYENIEKLCKDMDEQIQNVIIRDTFEAYRARIKFTKRTETRGYYEEVPKKGFLNKCIRFFTFDNYGYEEVWRSYEVDVFCLQKILSDAIDQLSAWKQTMEDSLKSYETQYSKAFKHFINRINDLLESEKKQINLNTKEIDEILDRINLINKVTVVTPIVQKSKPKTVQENKYVDFDMNNMGADIYFLANSFKYYRLKEYRNYLLSKVKNPKDIVVWGWDEHYINQFMDYFFSDINDNNIEKGIGKKKLLNNQQSISIVNEQHLDPKSNLYFNKNECFFVLVNAIQPGYTLKILNESIFKKYHQNPYVFVFDSLTEHRSDKVNEDNLMEAFHESLEFPKTLKISQPFSYMASHTDLYYSVLMHCLFEHRSSKLERSTEKSDFLRKMTELIDMTSEMKDKTVEYLDKFIIKE
ncbi:MAG: dynamin family protein [Candidatus Cloacimonadales bacterium]|jgi:GTPase Era involved in 16S rRNA processing|nr:dynamin family protein [Candidatus Cloacimonadales bacterium]